MKILETLKYYTELYNTEIKKIPLQLNLVKEINPNENAHSKILAQILRVSESNLKSFFNYIGGAFQDINVSNSTVDCEKQRIDISIKTKNGEGIIIENKIRNAIDQDNQIERYIEKLKKSGIQENKIYVIYLTNKGGKPSTDSMKLETITNLNDRYSQINYRDHVLPWLKYELLPTCQYRDRILISGVEQYINFLEIRFKKQDIYKDMSNNLEGLLKDEFGLDGKNSKEKLDILSEKIAAINELSNSAEIMQRNCLIDIFDGWKAKIPENYKDRIISNYEVKKAGNYFFLSVLFSYQGVDFACSIGKDNIEDDIFYTGISVRGTNKEKKHNEITEFCRVYYPEEKKSPRWYVWKHIDFEQVFDKFIEIINFVEQKTH